MANSVDPRESPFYDGPELKGLTGDARFDLARQLRIAARNKRIAARLGDERVRRHRLAACWGVALAIATIMGVLSALIQLAGIYALRHPHF